MKTKKQSKTCPLCTTNSIKHPSFKRMQVVTAVTQRKLIKVGRLYFCQGCGVWVV